ncbi:MAG: hypothetical protein SGJ27_30740 [Candidatus Melainabacteria bacterium]|nr:hypothetical protein [Candidatus Melainabacteria bacterium]
MNIYTYLKTDEKHLSESIWTLAKNYSEWTQDHVFAEIKNVIDSIHAHIDKKNNLLLSNVRDKTEMGEAMDKWQYQTNEINEVINSLVMIHVDEPGFEELVIKLAKMVDNLISFSDQELIPAVQKSATEEEVKRMNTHLDSLVLS